MSDSCRLSLAPSGCVDLFILFVAFEDLPRGFQAVTIADARNRKDLRFIDYAGSEG